MSPDKKIDNTLISFVTGLSVSIVTALIIYVFTSKGQSLINYFKSIIIDGKLTLAATIYAVPDIILFFVFNRRNMLKAAKGMLAATIVWALLVLTDSFI
ncbi:MAG TPA: hypothetical protein PLN06_00400 [Bacteroidales bacterium]|nr:hypothetical protein [Bacteroidales bacterium]HCI55080.1 hypothetical protein [Bacteroidales bacterium]HOU95070.1 hypothetical protein [Bacteroidales bacterium]HQG35771.1 hypothetical protein [Bacteroidales bacterium]HQG52329.1 hypothetical protein [Bacteroidales bacterium]